MRIDLSPGGRRAAHARGRVDHDGAQSTPDDYRKTPNWQRVIGPSGKAFRLWSLVLGTAMGY